MLDVQGPPCAIALDDHMAREAATMRMHLVTGASMNLGDATAYKMAGRSIDFFTS